MDAEQVKTYVEVAVQVFGVASMIAAVTPTPVDDGVLLVLRKVLDVFAFNFGHAKNADPK